MPVVHLKQAHDDDARGRDRDPVGLEVADAAEDAAEGAAGKRF